MSKFFKATALVLLCIVTLSFFSGCSLQKEYVYGDFKCSRYGDYVEITRLSEEGMEKSVLIIPQYIKDMRVNAVRKRGFMGNLGNSIWQSENLEKLYLPSNVQFDENTIRDCASLNAIIIMPIADWNSDYNLSMPSIRSTQQQYIFSKIYFTRYKNSETLHAANVTYYYNVEKSDNFGVYWLDNVEYGEKIVDLPPSDPVRDRYTFGGWYTEPECINEWDFATDTMPHPENSEEFYELELYAKWI